jgi:hypothetical protein
LRLPIASSGNSDIVQGAMTLQAPLRFATLASPLLLAIKLSFANLCIIPVLLHYCVRSAKTFGTLLREERAFYLPLLAFIATLFYSSFFGVNPLESLRNSAKLTFMFLLIPLFSELRGGGKLIPLLLALTLGLTIASFHTLYDGAYPGVLFGYPHGPLSEAGQIAIGIFAAIALWVATTPETTSSIKRPHLLFTTGLPLVGFLFLGFAPHLHLSPIATGVLALVGVLYTGYHSWRFIEDSRSGSFKLGIQHFLLYVAFPLFFAALVVNEKRGPWIGVCAGMSVLLFVTKPRLLFLFIPLTFGFFFGFEPIRERVFASLEHFLMVGGRSEIWELGAELLVRYPLGIGLENADIIKEFSVNIPDMLNHFHSNIINIAVETGWLGIAAYLWWMAAVLLHGFSQRKIHHPDQRIRQANLVTMCLTCGIVSWQVAGLFEYNFGDSEVFLVGLMVIGLLHRPEKGEEGKE